MINLTREEAQQVLDALINAKGYIFYNVLDDKGNRYDAAADILRAKLSEYPDNFIDALKFHTAMQELEPEPMAVVIESHEVGGVNDLSYYQEDINALPVGTKLYIAPLQHEWVGLTNEEFAEILCDDRWQRRPELMLLEVQAKLKEKNNG